MLTATRLRQATAVLATSTLLAGCGAMSADESGNGRRVVAAFYPLEYVAERVAGEHFDVTGLTRAGAEPHDLDPTVQETATLAEADLVVFQSGFQPGVDETVDQNATGALIDVAEVVDLIEAEDHSEAGHSDEDEHADEGDHTDGDEHADEDEHAHGDVDPHFWLDPLLMADLGDAVAAQLGELDADNAAEFLENAADLRADLEQVDGEYADRLAACEHDTVVVNHDAFGYLAKYDLHLEPILGLSPDAEPTPADLSRLQKLIRSEGITTVFAETLVSRRTAETLARDLGLKVAVLDPVEGLTDETAGEDYLSLMDKNLDALEQANGC